MKERVRAKIAIISDEISQDFEAAVALGMEWGVGNFEIRCIGSHRVPDISDVEREIILRTTEEYDITITAISPGLFKIPLGSNEVHTHLNEQLYRSCELAHQVGTEKIIVFGFIRPEGAEKGKYPQKVVDLLGEAAKRVEKEGIIIALENEHICWADTGKTTAEIVSKIKAKNLGINWDPCNALIAGEKNSYPQGYTSVKKHLNHLHIKDAREIKGEKKYEFVTVGGGALDWRGQIEALVRDGFNGYYTVETHFRSKVKASKACLASVREILSQFTLSGSNNQKRQW